MGRRVQEDHMATVTGYIDASPGDVFAVLADGWYYSGWVVGTSHMRAVEARWPAAGSRLFHASGVWPAALRDETEVEEVVPGERLVLIAKGGPLGQARVGITLAPEGDGTRVTMDETPVSGPGRWISSPVTDVLLRRRNVESLARLAALAERRSAPHEGAESPS
jgi:uncharacterized protein YndB with AHSA1/START domain